MYDQAVSGQALHAHVHTHTCTGPLSEQSERSQKE